MLGYLSLDIICRSKLTVFPRATLSENCLLLGTDNLRGQIFLHIFPPMEATVYILRKKEVFKSNITRKSSNLLQTVKPDIYRFGFHSREHNKISFVSSTHLPVNAIIYLTIIPRARVGYEMIDSQRGA